MKPTGATKEATAHSPLPWQWLPDEGQFIVDAKGNIVAEIPCQGCNPVDGEFLVTAVNERERLREALRAALNSLSRTVRRSYPNHPEEQMQISETMTVADARTILNDPQPPAPARVGERG